MSRYPRRCDTRRPRLVFAVFMIVAGILLFLSNLGWLPLYHVWDYWPLIFVVIGLGKISGVRRPSAIVVGGMFVLLGTMFTLINVGVFHVRMHDGTWPLSILFLAFGIAGLAKLLDGNPVRRSQPEASIEGAADTGFTPETWHPLPDSSPVLESFALMASINRKLETKSFQGGTLTCLLGNIEIDLRRSQFPQGVSTIVIDANIMMGAIKLRIPEAWRVDWNGVNIMANFEDKTTPPNTGPSAPQLTITGYTIMGNIEVES